VRLNFSTAKLSISTLIIMVFLLIIVSPTMAAQAPLAAPKVTAPTNGSALSREDIQVEWNTVSGAANYAYGLRDMTTNALLIDQTPTNETGFTISAEQLIEGHQYRIWVASEDSSGNVNAGYTYITINKAAPLAAPKVTAPTNGSTLSRDDDIQVEWNTVSNAANYAYGLRDMTTNALLIDKTPTNETGFTISAKQLIEGHQYRIWVASEDSSGTDYSGYTYITINKAAPLAAPKVTAPTNGSALSRDDIQVEWNTVSDAANYAYGLRDMTTNALLIDKTPTNETGFTISAEQLIEGHQYRIWVASEDSSGTDYSGYTYITINKAAPLAAPKVTAPTNGSTLSKEDIQVEWNTVPGAANYAYGLRDMTTNALLIDKTPTNETGFTISAEQLIEGHQYRIWVASEDSSGTDYSGYTYITINKAAPLAAPKVTAPTNGSTLSKEDIQVEWNTVPGAANYAYGLRDMTTNALLIDQTPTNETGFTISAAQLIEGHQYRIWVASEDSSGNVNAGYTYITISEAISVEQPLPEDIPSIPEQQVNEDNSSSLKVIINGNPVTFDVNPIVINNRTLVPLRKIFETLGAEVQWDAATQTITATNGLNNIKIGIGNSVAEKNGQAIELDIPPQIINNRTLVPLRFVSESFGANVNWDDSTKTINIDYMER